MRTRTSQPLPSLELPWVTRNVAAVSGGVPGGGATGDVRPFEADVTKVCLRVNSGGSGADNGQASHHTKTPKLIKRGRAETEPSEPLGKLGVLQRIPSVDDLQAGWLLVQSCAIITCCTSSRTPQYSTQHDVLYSTPRAR